MEREPDRTPYQEGKRAGGAHPALVIFGIIIGLWVFIWIVVPGSKSQRQQSGLPDPARDQMVATDDAPVMFRVGATVPERHAVSVIVPEQATTSQIISLLKHFNDARLANTLGALLPPTTPGHKLGDHAIADIYIVSEPRYGTAEVIKVLSRGAQAPGELYPQAIPFEEAMEHIRGHYRIDRRNLEKGDQASVGFADESGVHSRSYKRVF